MTKMKVFLGNLEHMWQKINIWTFPLNVGYVGAYAIKHLPDDIEVRIFKDPAVMIEAIKECGPDVVAVTYYVWTANIAAHVLNIAKFHNPQTLTVGGGPHFTSINANENTARTFFSQEGSFCDAFVVNQGERGFVELLRQFLACDKNVDELKRKTIPGCLVNNVASERAVQVGPVLDAIVDLDEIPSPYLAGLLDPFFEGPFAPVLETNRSCPYRCTFCAWGIGTDKLACYSEERVFAEIEYFSARCTNTKTLYIADANFAVLERDAEIAHKLYECHVKYGYPGNIMVNWNKTRPDRVLRTAREFRGISRIGASMQSFHGPTLGAVKRKNLSLTTVVEMAHELSSDDMQLFSELILGLPLETTQSHLDAIKKLMDVGTEIYNYNLHLLPGTEMETKESRSTYFPGTAWRLFDGCYGIYDGVKVFEGEENVIATSTMSEDELRSFRFVHFLIQLMWSKELYKDFLSLWRQSGIHPVDVVVKVANACKTDEGEIGKVYQRFRADHNLERFDTFEALSDYWSQEEAFNRLRSGDYGKLNYVYTFIILLEHRAAFEGFLYRVAEELVDETDVPDREVFLKQCGEVLRFGRACQLDLTKTASLGDVKAESFDFDILAWRRSSYGDQLKSQANSKFEYEFFLPDTERAFLQTQMAQFRSHSVNMSLRKLSEGISPDHLFYKVRMVSGPDS